MLLFNKVPRTEGACGQGGCANVVEKHTFSPPKEVHAHASLKRDKGEKPMPSQTQTLRDLEMSFKPEARRHRRPIRQCVLDLFIHPPQTSAPKGQT